MLSYRRVSMASRRGFASASWVYCLGRPPRFDSGFVAIYRASGRAAIRDPRCAELGVLETGFDRSLAVFQSLRTLAASRARGRSYLCHSSRRPSCALARCLTGRAGTGLPLGERQRGVPVNLCRWASI